MKLRLESYRVCALAFGSQTAFTDGTLTINTEEVCRLAHDNRFIAEVKVFRRRGDDRGNARLWG